MFDYSFNFEAKNCNCSQKLGECEFKLKEFSMEAPLKQLTIKEQLKELSIQEQHNGFPDVKQLNELHDEGQEKKLALEEAKTTNRNEVQQKQLEMEEPQEQFPIPEELQQQELSEEELKSIFTTLLLKLIEADQTIVAELQKIIPVLEQHRQKCKIAKTTGVSVAGAGTLVCVGSFIAGLLLAPVTFGASLAAPIVISGIVGTTATVAGGLTAAGTAIVDGVVTKNYLVQIQDLQTEQVDLANQVLNTLSHLVKYKVEKLMSAGENEEVAIAKVIHKLNGGNGTLSAAVVLNPDLEQEGHEEDGDSERLTLDSEETEPCLPKQTNHSREANKNITLGSLVAAKNAGTLVVTTMPGVQAKILSEVFKSSGTALGGVVAKTVVQSLTVAVGLVFTVVDVAYLVKGWNTSHPLVTEIQKIVAAIQEHTTECEALLGRVEEI